MQLVPYSPQSAWFDLRNRAAGREHLAHVSHAWNPSSRRRLRDRPTRETERGDEGGRAGGRYHSRGPDLPVWWRRWSHTPIGRRGWADGRTHISLSRPTEPADAGDEGTEQKSSD